MINPHPKSLIDRGYIDIGTHWDGRACGLGDVVLVTGLIRELNEKFPQLEIHVRVPRYTEVFMFNPRVREIGYGQGENSESNISGHYLLKLCDWFGLPCERLYGELYPSKQEKRIAAQMFNSDRPKAFIHIGNPSHISQELITSLYSNRYELIQVDQWEYRGTFVPSIGKSNQSFRDCVLRILFAGMSFGELFIGVNSGPMHIAACFQTPSIIFQSAYLSSDMLYPQNQNFSDFEKYIAAAAAAL